MKITTVLLLVTLGLVCSAYAAPIDVQEQIYSLLHSASSIQDYDDDYADTQVIGLLASIGLPILAELGMEAGRKVLKKVASKVPRPTIQDDDDEDDDEIEKLLQSLQDEADAEGFGKTIGKLGKGAVKVGKKYGPRGLSKVKKYGKKFGERYGEQILDSLIGRFFPPSGGSNDEEGDDVADMEGFGRLIGKLGKSAVKVGKKYGPKVVKGAKKYGKKFGETYGVEILDNLVGRLLNGGGSDEDDDGQIEAFLQNQAEIEGFLDKLKKLGSEAIDDAKRFGAKGVHFLNDIVNGDDADQ